MMQIATIGEANELPNDGKDPAAKALGAKGGAVRQEHDARRAI
jgi:hypothetical protein